MQMAARHRRQAVGLRSRKNEDERLASRKHQMIWNDSIKRGKKKTWEVIWSFVRNGWMAQDQPAANKVDKDSTQT